MRGVRPQDRVRGGPRIARAAGVGGERVGRDEHDPLHDVQRRSGLRLRSPHGALDPTGAIPGTVTLSIRRKLAATGAATDAVIALAGGPGQAAMPFANDAAQIMNTALATRDLVVFDQRGTGQSDRSSARR